MAADRELFHRARPSREDLKARKADRDLAMHASRPRGLRACTTIASSTGATISPAKSLSLPVNHPGTSEPCFST